ncbi:membrane-anchored mycosin MYCP [Pseudonocardia thermophila]|uniref:Membrane-anchored mycosin MYCP n=1 Tax=Pseudonocardia thermophila TaxID=1848 RepID=A0A1M6X4Q6_PSETH|nr:type VII secretion-associated serine protease mycosin [Pseudonocardia thermophila]SHL00918.1 membrane-anchored mycosin MYCP [Pseudonocardia thermophila]
MSARSGISAAALVVCLLALAAPPAVAAEDRPPVPPPVRSAPPSGARPTPETAQLGPVVCGAPEPAGAELLRSEAARMRLAELHRIATGRGQRVAVIDTGVAPHAGLAGRLIGGGDYLAGGDGLQDCDGHGTAVAGIIAAKPPPGTTGMVGVAPDAEVLSVRQTSDAVTITDALGAEVSPGTTTTLAKAIVLAVDQGATVINMSEAACVPAERAGAVGELVHAALDYAVARDVVVVAAMGNAAGRACTGEGLVSMPAWFDDEVLAVGAVDAFDAPAGFSFRAPYVDVAAPGTELYSLSPSGGYTASPVNGTSFAAPWVAGLAAVLRERYPQLSARQVTERIVVTARRAPHGRDQAVGFGVVDPLAAVTAEPFSGEESVATLAGTGDEVTAPAGAVPVDLLGIGVLVVVVGVAGVVGARR